jgi:hypothetical protein
MSIHTRVEATMAESRRLCKKAEEVRKHCQEVRRQIDRDNGVPPIHTAAREIFGDEAWSVIKTLYTEEALS